MAGGSGTLTWLQKAQNHIENSQEWRDFTVQLCDAAQQQMTESHVHFFTDLSAAEKAFDLQRAAKAIQGGDLCKALMSQVSTCLEEQLYIQVAHELQDGDRLKNKSALVLSHIKNGVEKQLRYEIQRKAEAQINGLQAEIKRLMDKRIYYLPIEKTYLSGAALILPCTNNDANECSVNNATKRPNLPELSIDAYSEGSLTAPAPSLQSLTPSQTLHPQPSPVQTPPPTVANGSNAAEQDSLNAATKEHLWNYNQDCKNAEDIFLKMITFPSRLSQILKQSSPHQAIDSCMHSWEFSAPTIARNKMEHYVQHPAIAMGRTPHYK
ncbi:hypothetical protein UY3_05051 [Chelonia mydas]|uniref:Uncharacterized protein n=1 Tax=Chelonia mydas TaxID=8469 RepID=M7C092_CHEMY|nr:hypothetical protein UY3_05051 [Chelonia mydas]